jgi:two-component system phosphate regulon sensor histidine kinase PhoR
MNPVVLAGLAGPLAVLALAAIVGLALGAGWAIAVLIAGGGGVIAHHLWNLSRLERWARSDVDAPVPEGGGSWRIALSALYRRVRTRSAHQRDLAHTIERFISAAEAIPDGMVVLDRAGRIRWANVRAQAHFGLDPAHDQGAPFLNLVRQPEIVRYLEAGDFTDAVVVDSQRIEGLTLSIQVVPFGADERLLMSRDVTKLEAIARMRRDFIANVSHELKTPLTVVSGFLETLQDVAPSPAQRERYLRLMAEQTRSMQRLVDDLLTLSALESERSVPHESPFAVAPLVREVAAEARALSAGAHTIVVEAGRPAAVNGSRDELASAFRNLVSNAIRYTPAGGTITLAWHEEHGGGVFAVTDTGIGIAAEHIPRLTERFYRVDRSRSRATGGTGLGLAIVKHVLLRHQATLDVMSVPGRGSTFAVHLPAVRVEWLPEGADAGATGNVEPAEAAAAPGRPTSS